MSFRKLAFRSRVVLAFLETLDNLPLELVFALGFRLVVSPCHDVVGRCSGIDVGRVELLACSSLKSFLEFGRNLEGQVCGGPQTQYVWNTLLLSVIKVVVGDRKVKAPNSQMRPLALADPCT